MQQFHAPFYPTPSIYCVLSLQNGDQSDRVQVNLCVLKLPSDESLCGYIFKKNTGGQEYLGLNPAFVTNAGKTLPATRKESAEVQTVQDTVPILQLSRKKGGSKCDFIKAIEQALPTYLAQCRALRLERKTKKECGMLF